MKSNIFSDFLLFSVIILLVLAFLVKYNSGDLNYIVQNNNYSAELENEDDVYIINCYTDESTSSGAEVIINLLHDGWTQYIDANTYKAYYNKDTNNNYQNYVEVTSVEKANGFSDLRKFEKIKFLGYDAYYDILSNDFIVYIDANGDDRHFLKVMGVFNTEVDFLDNAYNWNVLSDFENFIKDVIFIEVFK